MTRAGHRLLERIRDPMRELEGAYSGPSGQRIVITTTPSFAAS
jgi:hypothetical protein